MYQSVSAAHFYPKCHHSGYCYIHLLNQFSMYKMSLLNFNSNTTLQNYSCLISNKLVIKAYLSVKKYFKEKQLTSLFSWLSSKTLIFKFFKKYVKYHGNDPPPVQDCTKTVPLPHLWLSVCCSVNNIIVNITALLLIPQHKCYNYTV